MIINKDLFDQIGDLIERRYNDFTYMILGKDFLTQEQQLKVEALGLLVGYRPLLEILYLLVKQRSSLAYQTDRTFNELLAEIQATGIIDIKDRKAKSTIETASIMLDNIIKTEAREVAALVTTEIVKINKQAKVLGEDELSLDPDKQSKLMSAALAAIGTAFAVRQSSFYGKFTTELTNFVNNATVDAAKEQSSGDPTVYKRVMKDARLCSWCGRSYVNPDGTPRMFKLSELVANGSNYGKPKSQWLPVVEAHHNLCRCQLLIKETT